MHAYNVLTAATRSALRKKAAQIKEQGSEGACMLANGWVLAMAPTAVSKVQQELRVQALHTHDG